MWISLLGETSAIRSNQEVNTLTSKIWLLILSSNCHTMHCKLVARLSREQLIPDKFEYSYCLFARKCMDIVERSWVLITSGSKRDEGK